ncbi:MAG: UDP-glucose 4-epimerase GalE [Chloroflexi bacterium]|nr:UDP-glucose 4-epimerase GalE [Chloroflexota bacterium]
MRILVTGGAGYIGSVVAQELLSADHTVILFDNLSHGHRRAVPPGALLVVGDLADRAAVEALLEQHAIEAVIHLAALSIVPESLAEPARYFRANVVNTLNLLDAMLRVGVKRFVFSSSAAVYGEPSASPIGEGAPTQPTNPYGESKLAVERMLPWLGAAHGLCSCSLRYFNAAGASDSLGEDHEPETHLIPLVMQTALGRRTQVEIFGDDYATPDGTCIRDYIHVSDLAQAHILALEHLAPGCRIYNLGNGDGFSVREVVDAARQVTGRPIPAVVRPRRLGDPPVLVAHSDQARAELGWAPRYPDLRDIIATAWQWHLRHPQGYGDRAGSLSPS